MLIMEGTAKVDISFGIGVLIILSYFSSAVMFCFM